MASLGLHCARNHNLRLGNDRLKPNLIAPSHRFLSISNRTTRQRPRRISMLADSCSSLDRPRFDNLSYRNRTVFGEHQPSEKMDEWMRESVSEIVKNLREAPLLVHVYADNNGSTRLQTEKAIAEDWPTISGKWKTEETQSPDGVILVEELEDGEEDPNGGDCGEDGGARAWGVVVQGKGAECGPACYLLKTSRVGSGMGLFCTHFCLARVQSFKESALSQLTNCWLLK